MFFLISGEGASDLGTHSIDAPQKIMYEGSEFAAGPMAIVIEKIANSIKPDFAFSTQNDFALLPESALKQKERPLSLILSGKKRKMDTALFFRNAAVLGQFAKELEITKKCPVIAILFRDTDGTRSTRNGMLEEKRKSIEDGFSYSGCKNGLPMMPKPKSEAWLLCALQENAYTSCQRFENISGNDNSRNSAKEMLEERLQARGIDHRNIPEMLQNGSLDPNRIDMPSFNYFRKRLQEVLESL